MQPLFASPIEILHEVEIGLVITIGGWALMFPVRTLISKIKEAWDSQGKLLREVHAELTTQRTNCLTTLQTQGGKQIEVLEQVASTLNDMHLQQVEMTGYLKGSNNRG